MSEHRPTSRGSRTAAVVMLVVFVQVLIVAILGLGAIGRDRQQARTEAQENQSRSAVEALTGILDQARLQVLAALNDVRALKGYEELERLRADRYHGRHADLVKTVYQVDPRRGVIWSMDGTYRLRVPPAVRDAMIEETKEASVNDVATAMEEAYRAVPETDRLDKIRAGLEYVHKFPYLQVTDADYTIALGRMGTLIPLAEEAADLASYDEEDEAYGLLEETLLAAIEVVALNKDAEVSPGDLVKMKVVPEKVEAAIVALLPERQSIRHRVQAYRRALDYLEGTPGERTLVPALKLALAKVPEIEGSELVVPVGRWLIGVLPWVHLEHLDVERHLLVLMSQEAALHLLEDVVPLAKLDRLGLALEVVRNDELAMGGASPEHVAAAQDLRHVAGLQLPYTARLRWKTPPTLPSEGPGEFFYWGIIALSVTGLVMGGWVLMRIYRREVQLARLKADFVSNLSHELKTPLTSIAMWTEMLADERMTGEEDRKEALGILTQESDRLQGIVRRMLDTAKREARGNTYDLAPGDLNGVVGKSAERFGRIVTEPGLDLRIDLAPEALPVRMEAAAIDDLVSNLVSNAWKYKNGEEARVEVRTALLGRKAELTVADDGLGIPRGERRKVFQMFYRADAYLTRAAGTGLGLSLVRTIVRGHRGSIRIETGLDGRGTLFRIRFPLLRRAGERTAAPDGSSLGTMSPTSEAQFTP